MRTVLYSSCCGSWIGNQSWPKCCPICNLIFWRHAIPVATILQPVQTEAGVGLLTIKYGHGVLTDRLSLVSCHTHLEDPKEALRRTLELEACISLTGDHALNLHQVISQDSGEFIEIVYRGSLIDASHLQPFKLTMRPLTGDSVIERHIIHEPNVLAMDMETELVRAFFSQS